MKDEQVTVTQADRKAAAEVLCDIRVVGDRLIVPSPLNLAEAFARHRIAALQEAAVDRVTSEPYAPTRANPTVAGVDAAGEGQHG